MVLPKPFKATGSRVADSKHAPLPAHEASLQNKCVVSQVYVARYAYGTTQHHMHASKSLSGLSVVWVALSTESHSQNIRISQACMGDMARTTMVTPCCGLATLLALMLPRAYSAYLGIHVNTPIKASAQR